MERVEGVMDRQALFQAMRGHGYFFAGYAVRDPRHGWIDQWKRLEKRALRGHEGRAYHAWTTRDGRLARWLVLPAKVDGDGRFWSNTVCAKRWERK